jgi:LysM repeat protein
MSQSFVFALLALALVLPVLGAVVLRILGSRLSPTQLYGSAALMFGVAFLSVLLLARANVSSLQVGDLSLLLPAVAPAGNSPASSNGLPTLALPTAGPPTPAPTQPATATVTVTSRPASATPSPAPTTAPTATATPTSPPPTATPTAVPPTEKPAPPSRRTYTVKPGDTLRSIAEQFGVSVDALIAANHLTPAQADALRIGQELIIP